MMYEHRKSRDIASIVLIVLFLHPFNPLLVYSQDDPSNDSCDTFVKTVDALLRNEDRMEPEVQQAVATTAQKGLFCYGQLNRSRSIWLLEGAIWALDQLDRYREAEDLVDLFYETYVEMASEENRARFAMHRFKYGALRGDYINSAIAFQEADLFRKALPVERQAHHLLNGAFLYRHTRYLSRALKISQQAEELTAGDSTLLLVHARALLVKSEIILAMEQEKASSDSLKLTAAISDLERAISILRPSEDQGRFSIATVTLGRVHASLGDIEQAYTHFEDALTQAQARGDTRNIILAHLRRGSLHLEQGRLQEAEGDFNGGLALTDSSGIREFELSLLLGLAEAQEARHDLADARRIYRRVIDADLAGVSAAEVREAKERAQAALLRVMERAEQRSLPAFWFWAAVSFSLTLVGYLVYTRRRRRRGAGQAGISLHTLLDPQGLLILDGESPLLQQRLDFIAQVLRDPEAMLAKLEDPVFRAEVERQGVINNTMLFNCAAVLEEQATGQTFENDPANTLGRYLRQEFRMRHIPWPQTPDAWRWMLGEDKKGL